MAEWTQAEAGTLIRSEWWLNGESDSNLSPYPSKYYTSVIRHTSQTFIYTYLFTGNNKKKKQIQYHKPTRSTLSSGSRLLLVQRDGRLSWPRWLVTYRDGLHVVAVCTYPTHTGDRAFAAAGPRACNSLSQFVTDCSSPLTFKKYLTTYLFILSF